MRRIGWQPLRGLSGLGGRRGIAVLAVAVSSTVMSIALAQAPEPVPPVVLPVTPSPATLTPPTTPAPAGTPVTPAVVPPGPAVVPPVIPEAAPEATAPLVVPADQCDAMLQQVLAELDYWRSQGTPLPAPQSAVALPAEGAPVPAVAGSPAVAGPAVVGPVVPGLVPTAIDLAGPLDRPRVMQVAAALKEMKAKDAALVLADWDDQLATEVLARLPARASGAIATALPPAQAARLYARLSLLAITKEAP